MHMPEKIYDGHSGNMKWLYMICNNNWVDHINIYERDICQTKSNMNNK